MNPYLIYFFLFAFATTNNFQLRQIYYSYNENICAINSHDYVEINFTFQASQLKVPLHLAGTYCEAWVLPYVDKIQTFDLFAVNVEDKYVYFGVSLKKISFFGQVYAIYANTTLTTKKVSWKSEQYVCQIQGDGNVQHFNVEGYPITAFINVNCEKSFEVIQ